ncbi:protein Aim2p [[Candida] jaroonii]|uniref:Protein Aim2p n=1 Tax=[Candida] jaroonii TaxID=467808 RepID=A0ACA9XZV2_9ASCO|nr:protein Aim2p [[Candida] jaroonii]
MIDICCLKKFDHEGSTTGVFKTLGGLDSYVAGDDKSYDKVIVFLTDIYGHKFKNTQLVADGISQMTGMKVVVPDIIDNDPLTDLSKLQEWFGKHGPPITGPIVQKFFKGFGEEHKPKNVFAIGFCFGALFIPGLLAEDGPLTAGAMAHPTLFGADAFDKIRKPILISAGADDVRFTSELRDAAVAKLLANKTRFELNLFHNAPHGYEIKGDMSEPLVKYAKEKTMLDQAAFFSSFT